MAAHFEKELRQAIDDGIVAGATLYAVNKLGKTLMEKSFGRAGVDQDAQDMSMDTTFWFASCTKLLTSICVLQLVEKSRVKLHDPVSTILPELSSNEILSGFTDDGKPIIRPSTKQITLVHLLTHSSGIGYDNFDPLLSRYREYLGLPNDRLGLPLEQRHIGTLLFEPGEGWTYGVGVDWAGILVERVTGMRLGDYMRENIWKPLGMENSTFQPLEDKNVMANIHGRVRRSQGGKAEKMPDDDKSWAVEPAPYDFGGHGMYSSTRDYSKVMKSLVTNDEMLLKNQTVDNLLTKPCLEKAAKESFNKVVRTPHMGRIFSVGIPRETDIVFDHALGGAMVCDAVEGEIGRGLLYWGGLPNNNWYLDRETGVAGFYGTFIVPPGDPPTEALYRHFRKAIYEEAMKV